MELSAEQFAEWKEHPVTKEILVRLKTLECDIKDQLGNGATIGCNAEATHGFTNRAIGKLEAIQQLLNITFDDGK